MLTRPQGMAGSTVPPPRKEPQRRLCICLVSAYSGEATGGLASYVRCLAERLGRAHEVRVIARFDSTARGAADYAASEPPTARDGGAYSTHIIAPRPALVPALRQLARLVPRRATQGLARAVFSRAFQGSLAEAMPKHVDVVHYVGTGWELLGFAALAEARKRGAAFTVLPAVHPGAWGDSPLDVRLYNRADAVLTLSEHEKSHLIALGTDPALLHTVGLAPASEATGDGTRFRTRHGLENRPLVLFVGRKDQGKGYHTLRQAMSQVLATIPGVCLVAIGPDAEPPFPPVPDGALLDLGKASEADKADALAACDVFCMPSAHESFGITYVEAWSYGMPVVGGPAPAVRELVTDNVNGFCVSQEPDGIADALIRLLPDMDLRQRLGAAGREIQQERYTWDAVTEAHRLIFRDTLATGRGTKADLS